RSRAARRVKWGALLRGLLILGPAGVEVPGILPMNDLPFRYLACLYAAGGLIFVHALLQLFGFGHRPGLHRDPRRGPTALYDAITSAYSVVAAVLAFGVVGLLETLRGREEPGTMGRAAVLAI